MKCDFPPFGYINRQNKIAGYDVDVARRFAELAFGRRTRVSLTCVTTPSRIPALQRGDVDIIISTLTWTASREEIIDYSYPYYNATGRLLVPNNSPLVTGRLTALRGRRVATTRGSIYDRYIGNCFSGGDEGAVGLARGGAREPPLGSGGRVHVRRHVPAGSGGERPRTSA